MAENQTYYVPEQSKWPIVATVGLGVTLYGAAAIMVNGQQGESTASVTIEDEDEQRRAEDKGCGEEPLRLHMGSTKVDQIGPDSLSI